MKRYRHEPNGGLVPHEDGRYVDADIAQDLCDALEDILAFVPDEDHGFSCLGIALEKGHEALKKADKD